jgi:hypothetical protein
MSCLRSRIRHLHPKPGKIYTVEQGKPNKMCEIEVMWCAKPKKTLTFTLALTVNTLFCFAYRKIVS